MAEDGKQPKEEKWEGGDPTEPTSSGALRVPSTHSAHSVRSEHDRGTVIADLPGYGRSSVSSGTSTRSRSRSLSLPEDGTIPAITRRPSSRSLTGREDLGIPSPDYSKSPPPFPPGEEHSSVPIKKAEAVLDLLTTPTGAEATPSQSEGFVSDDGPTGAAMTKGGPVRLREGPSGSEEQTESKKKLLVSDEKSAQAKREGSNKPSGSREKLVAPVKNAKESGNPARASPESKIGPTDSERQSSKSKCALGSMHNCNEKSTCPSSVSLPEHDELSTSKLGAASRHGPQRFAEEQECVAFRNNIARQRPSDGTLFKVSRSVSANCVGAHDRQAASKERLRPRSIKGDGEPSWFLSLQSTSNKVGLHSKTPQEFETCDERTWKGRKNRRPRVVRSSVERSSGATGFEGLPRSANRGRRSQKSARTNGPKDSVEAGTYLHGDTSGTGPRSDDIQSADDIHKKISLEDGWCSLRAFEKSHLGRLGNNAPQARDFPDGFSAPRKKLYSNFWGTKSTEEDGTCVFDLDVDFTIPELPEGERLVLNIRSTWGDRHYVGLNGIEIFRDDGRPVEVEKIWADPADINVLPEYSHDPRVVTNLLDGVYVTRDDMHLWLAPFTPNESHYVYLQFARPVRVAVVRIWNYNKSRIHSFRGVRYVEVTLDGRDIFKGDIARACGETKGSIQSFGDTILFTTDEDILEAVSRHDKSFRELADLPVGVAERIDVRPPTADREEKTVGRPFTTASHNRSGRTCANPDTLRGKVIELRILENWGDPNFVGLTSIEISGADKSPVEVKPKMLMVFPTSHQTAEVARLVDGTNVTTDGAHMWRVPLAERITLRVCLRDAVPLTALKIWNYNENPEDSYQGIKLLSILVDGRSVCPASGLLVRKASGHCHFDFVQEIKLGYESLLESCPPPQTVLPHGFVFEIQILSTWGDVHYVGLNGLELRDATGRKMPLTKRNVTAFPESVNILENVENDVRTPDKLIDGSNASEDARHAWLAPMLPHNMNRVYIIFDTPVVVSSLRLWNYRKTPSRGVKDFRVCVDELLIFTGELPRFDRSSAPYHTLRFASSDVAACSDCL